MTTDDEQTGPGVGAVDIQHHADTAEIAARLATWLTDRLGPERDVQVTGFDEHTANGMSSSTVLFTAAWQDGATVQSAELVARIAPDPAGVVVFPDYDLGVQYDTMRIVAATGVAPVPPLRWFEPSGEVLGQPFFVMDRVEGQVPPDMLPYTFGDNWLFDATPAQRARLQSDMIDVLAGLHGIEDAPSRFGALEGPGAPEGHLARHLARTRAWYDWSVADSGIRSPLVETALNLLDETFPTDPGPTVLSWGDARIGNVLFADFSPAAVLDWEMADLGPRELDLIWFTYSHRVFQDLAEGLGLPGLADFLAIDDVLAAYEAVSGHPPRNVEWHLLYAAVRWACAFLRTGARQAHLDGAPMPEDGDSLLHNRPSLTAFVERSSR